MAWSSIGDVAGVRLAHPRIARESTSAAPAPVVAPALWYSVSPSFHTVEAASEPGPRGFPSRRQLQAIGVEPADAGSSDRHRTFWRIGGLTRSRPAGRVESRAAVSSSRSRWSVRAARTSQGLRTTGAVVLCRPEYRTTPNTRSAPSGWLPMPVRPRSQPPRQAMSECCRTAT